MTLDAWLAEHRDAHLEELFELLRIPSVSTDAAHRDDVRAAADWMCEAMKGAGLSATIYETKEHPIVYGEWLEAGPDAPTVLVYGHYDVQPPDPLDLWRNPPFEPTIEDGNIIARGATDDKGQMYCHIKGIAAHMAVNGRLPVNAKVLIEGEEEIGSPNLEPFIREHSEMLRADAVVISDSPMFAPGRPSITYGLRGLTYVEVEVTGPSHDLHSGLYGGAVANPINALSQIIASMHDEQGRITIDGFYDDVLPLTDEERAGFAELGHDEAGFRRDVGVSESPGEAGYTVLERIWARPTLDCNGVWGGYIAEGAKTVLPSKATAKVSCRLVPNQRPGDIERKLRDHAQKVAPEGVKVEVRGHHGGAPVLVDRESTAVMAAKQALSEVWGVPTVFTRGGGSIPIVASFASVLGIDSVLMGLGLEDDRLHSPNEKFAVENYFQGIRASAKFFDALAKG